MWMTGCVLRGKFALAAKVFLLTLYLSLNTKNSTCLIGSLCCRLFYDDGSAQEFLIAPSHINRVFVCRRSRRAPTRQDVEGVCLLYGRRPVLHLVVATNYVIYTYTFYWQIRHTPCSIHTHTPVIYDNKPIHNDIIWFQICPELYFRGRWHVET